MNLFIPYWLAAGVAYLLLALAIGWVFVALVNLSWRFIAEALRKAKLWWPFALFIADKAGRKRWQDIAEVEGELQKARREARENWQDAYDCREALKRVVYNLPEDMTFESAPFREEFRQIIAEARTIITEGRL